MAQLPQSSGPEPRRIGYKQLWISQDPQSSKFPDPVLRSSTEWYIWKPGTNVSSMDVQSMSPSRIKAEKARGFQLGASEGFYSMESPELLIESGYYPGGGDVPVALENYGDLVVTGGEGGFRSHKAKIIEIFSGGEVCDFCREAPATMMLELGGKKDTDYEARLLCKTCYKKARSCFPKGVWREGVLLDEILELLADKYQVDILPLPPQFVEERRKRRTPRYG